MPIIRRAVKVALLPLASVTVGWYWYIRNTEYTLFGPSTPDYQTAALTKLNPNNHPPVLVDHALRRVPLNDLRFADDDELLVELLRSIWSGSGFLPQRWLSKRINGSKSGTEGMLWDKEQLESSVYDVGTRFVDHFEVLERTPTKVAIRCGDSPLIVGPREWDGIFTVEVTREGDTAVFHLKSIFFDSRAEGLHAKPFPGLIRFLHQHYTCLWMETGVRKLQK